MANKARREVLSKKFVEMGKALLEEGYENDDYNITQSGTIMLVLAALVLDLDDMVIFAELCSMFSAKKILMEMSEAKTDNSVTKILKKRIRKTPKKPDSDAK